MIWIVPIGGKGARTQILGEFKPFIKIRGHKMLSWLICSVKNNVNLKDRFIFTTTEYFANKFNVEKEIEEIFKTHKLENRFTLCQFT